MATPIENVEQLKQELEKIQNQFNASLVSKLNNLLNNTNQLSVADFNNAYDKFVVAAQNEANISLNSLKLDRLDIDEKALIQVNSMIDSINRPRAGNRPSMEPAPNRSLEAGAQAGSRFKPMDAFRNADESPNDKIPQQEPFNQNEIDSFSNSAEPVLHLKHQLKFTMPKPKPGQKPKPEFRARALPRPTPF